MPPLGPSLRNVFVSSLDAVNPCEIKGPQELRKEL